MELNNRKNINNLPKYGVGADPMSIFSGGLGFLLSSLNSFDLGINANDILNSAGRQQKWYHGYGYSSPGTIDVDRIRGEVNAQSNANTLSNIGSGAMFGATAGSLLGPIGSVGGGLLGGLVGGIAGLFGADSREDELKEQLKKAQVKSYNEEMGNKSLAATQYARNKYANNTQYVLHAQKGKDPVDTTFGRFFNSFPNSVVEGQEVLHNSETETSHVVPGSKSGDVNPAIVQPQDSVISNFVLDNPILQQLFPFVKYARNAANIQEKLAKKPSGSMSKLRGKMGEETDKLNNDVAERVLSGTENLQASLRQLDYFNKNNKTKSFKKQHFRDGWDGWDNLITTGLGALVGLNQYNSAKSQDIYSPSTYIANPYEGIALNKLASLKVDYMPVVRNLRNQEHSNLYNLVRQGGLSSKDRTLAQIAIGKNTQDAISNTILAMQEKNNAYISNYASSMLQAGQADRVAQMAANQHDLEYYSRAHAAREEQKQTGLQNMVGALQQGLNNRFTRVQFNDTMNLYRQKLESDRLNALENLRNSASTLPKGLTWNSNPVASLPAFLNVDFGKMFKINPSWSFKTIGK